LKVGSLTELNNELVSDEGGLAFVDHAATTLCFAHPLVEEGHLAAAAITRGLVKSVKFDKLAEEGSLAQMFRLFKLLKDDDSYGQVIF
jgi:hypothetical protein